jgi:hypothetical protein
VRWITAPTIRRIGRLGNQVRGTNDAFFPLPATVKDLPTKRVAKLKFRALN